MMLMMICAIGGAMGFLEYEEKWCNLLEGEWRQGCVFPALPGRLGWSPGPCWVVFGVECRLLSIQEIGSGI